MKLRLCFREKSTPILAQSRRFRALLALALGLGTRFAQGADFPPLAGLPRGTPLLIAGSPQFVRQDLTNAVAIHAEDRYWVALRADGTVVRGGLLADDSFTASLSNIVAVSAGGAHTLALRDDGKLFAWIAQGNVFLDQILPLPEGLGRVAKIAAGYNHSVVLDTQGRVWAWGANTHGPYDPPAWATNVLDVAAGQIYCAAILADGTVRSWGGISFEAPPPEHKPAIQVDVSMFGHALSLRNDGRVFAWGNNSHGQAQVPAAGLTSVVQVAAGGLHSAVLKSDGTAVGWGNNEQGQLDIPVGMKFLAVAAGNYATYGLTRAPVIGGQTTPDQAGAGDNVTIEVAVAASDPYRTYWYVGDQLRATTAEPRLELANVQPVENPWFRVVESNEFGWTDNTWVRLAVYDRPLRFTRQPADVAILPGGTARFEAEARGSEPISWQWQFEGQDIPGATGRVLELAAAATTATGEYRVVARNALGAVASEPAFLSVGLPVIAEQPRGLYQRPGFPTVLWARAVSATPVTYQWWLEDASLPGEAGPALDLGPAESAITGAYWLTLANDYGTITSRVARVRLYNPPPLLSQPALPVNLGSWIPPERAIPPDLTAVLAAGTGDTHGLAVRADGQLVGWGTPSNGGEWNPADIPADVGPVAAIAVGRSHNTVLRPDGTVRSWGATYGEPTNLTDVIAISAGAYGFNLALRRDGTVVQWPEPANLPDGLTNVIAVASGTGSSMSLAADGTVMEWMDPRNPVRHRFQSPQAIAIATSEYGRWCLLDSGEVLSWNNSDQPPQPIPGVTNAIALTCDTTWGGAHCLLADGRVISQEWGLFAGLEAVAAISGSQRSLVALTRAPFADVPPAGTNVPPAGRLELSVRARSSTPLRYQWEYEGLAILGATGPAFVIESVSAFDRGEYRVRLINADHEIVTPAAMVRVTGPVEYRPLSDQTLAAGTDLSASPVWAGEGPVVLQWEKDGTEVSGATNATLTVSNVQSTDAGVYRLRATNPYGASTSDGFRLTVQPSVPAFILAPQDVSVPAGSEVALEVAARGSEPISWQWFFRDIAIPGATNATLRLVNVQAPDAGDYAAEARNRLGLTRSPVAALEVQPSAPVPVGGEGLRLVLAGNTALLERPFLGSEPVTWQWRRGGSDLAGATNRALELAAVQTADAGPYRLVVRNTLGEAESAPIHLTVVPTPGDGTVVGWGSLSPPAGLTGVVALDGGLSYALALKRDGTVIRFGREVSKELTPPAGLNQVVRIAAGTGHACALREDGGVVAWGFKIPAVTDVPADPGPVVDLAAGGAFSLALRRDGTVIGWGLESESYGSGPLQVPPEATNVIAIAAQRDSAVALRADGSTVWMGRTASAVRTVPVDATNLVAIDVGAAHAIALRQDGKVFLWGTGNAIRPVPPATNVTQVVAGFTHSLLLGSDGLVSAFGDRSAGKTNVPTTLSNVVALAAGSDFSLAVTRTPVVLTNPVPLTVVEGTVAEMSVVAVGPGQLQYLWSRDGTNLVDQTNATLRLASVRPSDAGIYRVKVSNPWGAAESSGKRLTVLALPFITQEPADASIPAGTNLTLTVGAGGAPPLAVQWRFESANLDGATAFAWTLTNVQAARAGGYDAVVTSPYGAATSRVARISVVPSGPGFIAQPQSLTVPAGAPARFQARVYGSEPFTFIWRRGGGEVARTEVPELVIPDPQARDAGAYTLTVSNALGQATCPAVELRVNPSAPRVVRQPADVVGTVGGTAELAAEFQGTRPMGLQWFRDGGAVPGATGTLLRLAALRPEDQAGYTCRATNALGPQETRIAALAVDPPALLSDLPDQTVAEGDDVTFAVRASGSEPRAFSWSRDGAPIRGGAGGRLILSAVQRADAGDYQVVVSNATGVVQSRRARLTVNDAAVRFARGPLGLAVLERSLALLNADARGTPPIEYRWFRNGVAVPGATNSWLLFRRTRPEQAGSYTLVISNRLGNWASDPAPLTVVPAPPGVAVSWGPADWARPAATDVVQFGWGWTHGTLLRADGTVLGWGYDSPAYHQDEVPADLANVVEIAVGHVHSAAITADGRFVGSGGSLDGQLSPPAGSDRWAAVSAAGFHTAGVQEDGRVVAFGGSESEKANSPPDGTNTVAVALGDTFLAALRCDGSVVVWTLDGASHLPVPANLEPAVEIAAGQDRIVTRHASGVVRSWSPTSGALLSVPEAATNVIKLAVCDGLVLAQQADGGLMSWGDGEVPQPLPAAVEPAGVFAGYGRAGLIARLAIEHPPATAVVSAGDPVAFHVTAWAAGDLHYQWLHAGSPVQDATNAWLLLPRVAAGDRSTYAVQTWTDDAALESAPALLEVRPRVHGAVVGWGNPASPVLAQLAAVPPRVRALAGSRDHALALLEDGTVVAWGNPGPGGTTVPAGLGDVVQVAVGDSHYLALHRDGQVTAWGTGDFGQHVTPAGLSNVIRIAAGPRHSLAILRNGTAFGWGYDAYGQASPPPLRGLVAVAGGGERSAALHGNGTLSEWGQYHATRPLLLDLVALVGGGNYFGAVAGNGDVHIWREAGLSYPSLSPAEALAIGPDAPGQSPHYVTLESGTGRVKAAGRNDFGQATPPTWLRNVIAVGATFETSLAVTTLSLRQQPGNVAVLAGSTAVLSVEAVGAEPLQYRWQHDGKIISGATESRLSLAAARPEDSGIYTVTVANAFAELTSEGVLVSILSADAPLLVWHWLPLVENRTLAAAVRVEPGKRYSLQFSDDLLSWMPLQTVQPSAPVVQVFQPIPTTVPARFYRLMQVAN